MHAILNPWLVYLLNASLITRHLVNWSQFETFPDAFFGLTRSHSCLCCCYYNLHGSQICHGSDCDKRQQRSRPTAIAHALWVQNLLTSVMYSPVSSNLFRFISRICSSTSLSFSSRLQQNGQCHNMTCHVIYLIYTLSASRASADMPFIILMLKRAYRGLLGNS